MTSNQNQGQQHQNQPGGGIGTGPQRGQPPTDQKGDAGSKLQQQKQPQQGGLGKQQAGMGQQAGSGSGSQNTT